MSERNQLTIFDSPFDRDDTEYMPGIDQRIHSAFPRIHPAFDFAVAAIGLIVFAPIFLVTSIAIKLDSRGPIFIREPKVGHNNQVIQVFKFRCVAAHAESGICKRLTRIGQVLGETGIDQLPQLFNVLRGEMLLADLLRAIGRDGVFLP
jgi:lipopolysaccharide/colanic/teichoic acid biosynthesis glycosyltransferase